jgi:inhibitor of KinA
MDKPIISLFGSNGISLVWEEKIDPNQHTYILAFTAAIEERFKTSILETVTTYHSTLIFVKSSGNASDLLCKIKEISTHEFTTNAYTNSNWLIPVCYDTRFGLDLEHISNQTRLSVEEIVRIHTGTPYRIYFSGFLPGFLYLGGLDSKIHVARKSTPRLNVSKGAVGIGGAQTGIYPKKCPGGWQILGQTPIEMFDISSKNLTPFKPGDTIQFESVEFVDFLRIEKEISLSKYQLKKISYD